MGFVETFLNWYAAYAQRRVNKRADKVRAMQAESGKDKERVVRYRIFEADSRRRDVVQRLIEIVIRVRRDGSVERLPKETEADVTVITDFPVVWGVYRGTYTQVLDGGGKIVHKDFTPFDAVRLGRVDWEGRSSALDSLMLLERRVLPELLDVFRAPELTGETGPAAPVPPASG